MKAKLKKKMG